MKKYDKLQNRIKQLDEEIPASYPSILVIDESKGETIKSKMKEYNIPEHESNNVVWIVDDVASKL